MSLNDFLLITFIILYLLMVALVNLWIMGVFEDFKLIWQQNKSKTRRLLKIIGLGLFLAIIRYSYVPPRDRTYKAFWDV
jgi:hypothetical protein